MDNIKSSVGTEGKKGYEGRWKAWPLDCDTVSAELVLRRSQETRLSVRRRRTLEDRIAVDQRIPTFFRAQDFCDLQRVPKAN